MNRKQISNLIKKDINDNLKDPNRRNNFAILLVNTLEKDINKFNKYINCLSKNNRKENKEWTKIYIYDRNSFHMKFFVKIILIDIFSLNVMNISQFEKQSVLVLDRIINFINLKR